MYKKSLFIAVIFLCAILITTWGPPAGEAAERGPNRTVWCGMGIDDRPFLGGDFTLVGRTPVTRMAILNTDGSVDPHFNVGANGTVFAVAIQPDAKLVIGGDFTTVGRAPRSRIARLNPNGSVDPGFIPQVNGTVRVITLQPDGKILIGGDFTIIDNAKRNRIARFNPSGRSIRCLTPTLTAPFIPFMFNRTARSLRAEVSRMSDAALAAGS